MMENIDFRRNIALLDRLFPSQQRIRHFLTVKRLIKNWHVLVKMAAMPDQSTTIVLMSGKRVKVKNFNGFLDFWHSEAGQMELLEGLNAAKSIKIDRSRHIISFTYKKRRLRFKYAGLDGMLEATLEWIRTQFFEEQYAWLDAKGTTVVDIGASVGDTAMFFALNGAKEVYGFEIDNSRARLAAQNAKLNGFGNIHIINAGCGKQGFITFGNDHRKVKIESLASIVKRYMLKDAVLKMDCEGCEYYSILNSDDKTLRSFAQIMLEYHHGYRNIEKRLRDAGFRVKHTRPEIFRTENNDGYLGYLYAERMRP